MKNKVITPLILFTLLIPSILYADQLKVVRVSDGDSIKVLMQGTLIRVRLVGIDAPELGAKEKYRQPFSQKAKKYLSSMILNESVNIERYGVDRYSRILGIIFYDGKNINLEMVRAGLAEVYRGKKPKGFDVYPFLKTEYRAQQAKRGIWSLGDNYLSPRQWRKTHR
jgi:endonuclease YncB( thermonuclease family)